MRAAQLRQIGMLKLMLALTMVCAFGFMGIKAVEYNGKWKHGLLWAGSYQPHLDHSEGAPDLIHEENFEDGGQIEKSIVDL